MNNSVQGLDWAAIEAAHLDRDPYEHAVVDQSLSRTAAFAIPSELPDIRQPGSFPLSELSVGPALAAVIDDLQSERFRRAMERLFAVDLGGKPTVVTLRGYCGPRDGRIHTDSASKILSVLLYLNHGWVAPEGRLRLLGPSRDLNSPAMEIPPTIGRLLVFRRSETSWHGHTPFIGRRRVLQFNYLEGAKDKMASRLRHRLSAIGKRLVVPAGPP